MQRFHTQFTLFLCLFFAACTTPRERFECRLDQLLDGKDARIGMALLTPEGRSIVRNDTLLPMMSVFKFPVALAALDRAEKRGTPLTHPVMVSPEWLDTGTYSPMRDSLPAEGGTVTLGALLRYAVVLSDNIACDLLLDFADGPAAVEAYVRALGIDGIRIRATEREMHLSTENQRFNTARPSAICDLFARFLRGGLLCAANDAFLRQQLMQAATGPDKLKAGLPANTVLGHKTGSSDRTAQGLRIADNDAGYVVLPDGRTYCIAVFVTSSSEDDQTNAAIIANISSLAYEFLTADCSQDGRPAQLETPGGSTAPESDQSMDNERKSASQTAYECGEHHPKRKQSFQ